MKKLIVFPLFVAVFGLSNLFSQTVNDIPIKDIDVEYIQIIGTSKLMSNKVTVKIDFGQENNYWNAKDTKIKDQNGKLVVFNSMIDALNFLSKNGYEFIDAYTITINSQNIYHYMLKRKKIE